MEPEVLSVATAAMANLPPDIAHTMGSAAAIAGMIRGLVALLKLPMLGEVWKKVPWWVKPTILVVATLACGFTDALAMGQKWYLALGAAVTGLGGAVVSHEWQALFAEQKSVKTPPSA